MTSLVTYSGKDYGNEGTRCSLRFPTVSSANYDAVDASIDSVQAAINNVTVHNLSGIKWSARDEAPGAKATDPDAQRERKWRVSLVDATDPLGNWSFEIGMADSALLASDSENMDVSGGLGAALVTALETYCVSRLGNAVTVESVKLVGRKS